MKKLLLYLLIVVSFVGFEVRAQNYSVGDTATFEYYDPGFFSGFYSSKYMCRAVTDYAYIFSAEQPYKITGVYTGSGNVIVYDPNSLQFFKFSNGKWNKFGVSGVKFLGKSYIKQLRAGRMHFYAVATDGIYVFNGSNWTKKVDRKDVVDVTASPTVASNLTQYIPYFLTKFSVFTTKRNYMGPVIKLGTDLFVDEGFEPEYQEDTTLSEWTTTGNVAVHRSIVSGQVYYVLSLSGTSTAEKAFTLPARVFKFRVVPIISNSNAHVNVQYLDNNNSPVFTIGFGDDSLYLNDEFVAELQRYSVSKIWGEVNIPTGELKLYLGDSLIVNDTSFAFSGALVNKVRIVDNGGTIYFDEINVSPQSTGIFASPSSKNTFYLTATDGIYKYSNGTWSKIYDGSVIKLRTIDQNTIFALTGNDLIVKTTDEGTTWDTLAQSPLEKVYDFAVSPVNNELIIASGVPGIFEYSNGTWTNISGSLLNWSPPEYVDTIYAVDFSDSSTLVLGTGQGVFMSGDSLEDFNEVNTGILKSFITSEQVQLLSSYVDSAYNVMNSFFNGLARDVDNDPRIVVLAGDLSPKLTSGETKIIPILGVMNPELNYVRSAAYPHGDGHELIEIDVYDDSLNTSISSSYDIWRLATYRATAKLFFWTHDTEEEDWLIEGMGGIGEYLAKYSPGSPDTSEYKISPLYSLKKIEESPYKVDFFVASLNRPYLFLLHLWAKYGIDAIRGIFGDNISPAVVGLSRISQVAGVSEEDLYKDWVLDVFNGRYMDMTPNLSINLVEKLFPPAYATRQTFLNWSFGGFSIELPQTDTLGYLRFNGINNNGNSLFDVYYKVAGDTQAVHVENMDSHGDAIISNLNPVQGEDTTVYYFIVFFANRNLDDNASASYAVKKDTIPPTVIVNYFQNSLADQNVNVYAFTNEPLYDEVNDTVPSLYLFYGNDTSIVDFSPFDTYGDTLIYSTSFTISNSGIYRLKAFLQDYAGNSYTLTDSVLAWYLQGGSKTLFTGFNGEIVLEIPENAASLSGYAMYSIIDGSGYFHSPNMVFVFPQVRLNTPARIEIPLEGHKKNEHIFVWYDHSWHDAGGTIDLRTGRIVASITRLGPITLMESSNSSAPTKFDVNLTSTNLLSSGKLSFEVSVPKATSLSANIYGPDGRLVARIFNRSVKSGKYSLSYKVDNLKNGVYFIVVRDVNHGIKVVRKVIKF